MKLKTLVLFISAMSFAAMTASAATPTLSAAAKPAIAASTCTPAQQQEIGTIVHQYLTTHPEVLMEMAQELQGKQMAAMQEKAKSVISKVAVSLLNDPASPVVGNPKATMSVVEFYDYQCPHCKAMEPEITSLLTHNKDLKVIYKELPIFGVDSEFAAKAALAAGKQGKFAAMNAALLKATGPLPSDAVLKIATSVGLDVKKLQADLQDPAYAKEIAANQALASQIGMAGTPAFVVLNNKGGSQYIPGQTNEAGLQKAIDALK